MSERFKAGLEQDGATHGEEVPRHRWDWRWTIGGVAAVAVIAAVELTGLDERIDTDHLKDTAQQMGEIILSPFAPNLESLDVFVVGDN